MTVSDPAFIQRLRALAEEDQVRAAAVLDVANQPDDGGSCVSYSYVFLRNDGQRSTVDLPPGLPWEMVHFRLTDDAHVGLRLTETVGGPATSEQLVPTGALEIIDLAPGYTIAVHTSSGAPDWATANRWTVESRARRKAILRRFDTKTPGGRSAAVRALMAPAAE